MNPLIEGAPMSTWTDVAALDDVFEGASLAVAPHGLDIALFNVEGTVYATHNQCSHGNASLCDGYLLGHEVECPFHQGRFDVRTGQATELPCTEAIKIWPVKVESGRVLLDLG
jgi:naphthalene 1,2-dioxygenase system ferredoxin subunit